MIRKTVMMNAKQHQQLLNLIKNQNNTNNINENSNIINQQSPAPSSLDINGMPPSNNNNEDKRIVNSVENFLKRFKTNEEIAQIIETFQLKMAIHGLKCVTIERRVNGVSYIADICSRTRRHAGYGYTTRFITPELLMKWIEEHKLLQLLFGKGSHPQLMKQSVDILKFICTESKLKISHLDIIWEAMERAAQKQDDVENELQTLCSVIDSLTYYLDLVNLKKLK